MVFLSEMVRKIADEDAVLADAGPYTVAGPTVCDWTTQKTQSVTLTKTQMIVLKFTTYVSSPCTGAGRVCIDAVPIVTTGYMATVLTVVREARLVKAAGTYSITFDLAAINNGAGEEVVMTNLYVGLANFADLYSDNLSGTVVNLGAGLTSDIIAVTALTSSVARVLPVGSIKNYCLKISFCCDSADRIGNMVAAGGGDVAAKTNFRLYIDGAQVSWTTSVKDSGADPSNLTFGTGCYGTYHAIILPAAAKTLKITCVNSAAGAQTVSAYAYVTLCPWILPDSDSIEPVNLDFPVGSTFYVITEPFIANATKETNIGHERCISFGDATDYYSTETGTGILVHDYIFEAIPPSQCQLLVGGSVCCISILAVDIR